MSISSVVTRGYRTSIASVVLRGYSAGAAVETPESDSTAGLRYYSRTLDMPGVVQAGTLYSAAEMAGIMAGSGRALFTEVAALVCVMAELGESVTVSGDTMTGVVVTPYAGALMAGTEVEGRRMVLYVSASDFDDAGGALGDACTVRSISYTIGRIERYDAPLVRLELVR